LSMQRIANLPARFAPWFASASIISSFRNEFIHPASYWSASDILT
jgi:hypothetical protein